MCLWLCLMFTGGYFICPTIICPTNYLSYSAGKTSFALQGGENVVIICTYFKLIKLRMRQILSRKFSTLLISVLIRVKMYGRLLNSKRGGQLLFDPQNHICTKVNTTSDQIVRLWSRVVRPEMYRLQDNLTEELDAYVDYTDMTHVMVRS